MTIHTYADHVHAYPYLTNPQRQRLGVEPSGKPLNDDGIIGPKTKSGIFLAPSHPHGLCAQMLRLSLLGAREEGRNNQGRWPAYLMGDRALRGMTPEQIAALGETAQARWSGVTQGPFCAGTVSTAVRLAYGDRQPWSLSARSLTRKWAEAPGQQVALATCEAGDLICWRREVEGQPAAGHIGVVAGRSPSGLVLVLEGNGSRRGGAVGLYGYSLKGGAQRGTQSVILLARRADLNPQEPSC